MSATPPGFASRLYSSQKTGVPDSQLNPGDNGVPPFAMVQLNEGTYMTIYTAAEAYAWRDAFQRAGDLLSEAAS